MMPDPIMTARNPIIPGFAPDPSIVRIDDTFYIVNSSFHLYPGLPIFASKDLIAWRHIGNAIHRLTQINLSSSGTLLSPSPDASGESTPACGGLYAPTIRHYKGTTYIVCTNVIHNNHSRICFQNFIISTRDICEGQWSDPVWFDFYGIDPDLFFDDDGRAYITGSSWRTNPSTINCFEIDMQTGHRLSDEQVIWHGHSNIIPEGPHIYKRHSYYYLLDAEGGTHAGHCIAISRSQNIWGPYESCDQNPILKPTSDLDRFAYCHYNGHGDLVQDASGRWWLVCLGVRKDQAGRMVMGRETFLTPVEWPQDQAWPCIQQPISKILRWPGVGDIITPGPPPAEAIPSPFAPTLDLVWIRDPDLTRCQILADGKTISLLPSVGDLTECTGKATSFVGRRPRRIRGSATVTLSATSTTTDEGVNIGLAYYKDEHRLARISYHTRTASVDFEVLNRAKSPRISKIVALDISRDLSISSIDINFRIVYTEEIIHFQYRIGRSTVGGWQSCGLIDTLDMTGDDFTGPVIGVFATGEGATWYRFEEVDI